MHVKLLHMIAVCMIQVILGSSWGIAKPQAWTWFSSSYFTVSLGFLMLSMGLTLTFKDLSSCHMPFCEQSECQCLAQFFAGIEVSASRQCLAYLRLQVCSECMADGTIFRVEAEHMRASLLSCQADRCHSTSSPINRCTGGSAILQTAS